VYQGIVLEVNYNNAFLRLTIHEFVNCDEVVCAVGNRSCYQHLIITVVIVIMREHSMATATSPKPFWTKCCLNYINIQFL